MLHHDFHQFGERSLTGIPAQQRFGFSGITQQLLHFGGTEILRIDGNQFLARRHIDTSFIHPFAFPAQFNAHFLEGQGTELAHRMVFAGRNDKIFGSIVLKNHPHTLHIILGIAPVAQRIQISQIQFVLISLGYTCGSQSNLACYEIFTTAFTLMVEQDAVHGKHTVTFTIVLGNPETILLGHPIRRTGIEGSRFLLRHFLYQSEQFGSRCLINLGLLFQAQNTDRFQHTQRAYRIRFRCVLGYIETYFHMALSSQIIDFIGLYSLNDTYQRTTVGHIPPMQIHQTGLLHITNPLVQIKMFDTTGIE